MHKLPFVSCMPSMNNKGTRQPFVLAHCASIGEFRVNCLEVNMYLLTCIVQYSAQLLEDYSMCIDLVKCLGIKKNFAFNEPMTFLEHVNNVTNRAYNTGGGLTSTSSYFIRDFS